MHFPLDFRFKLIALASQISVRDNHDRLVCYVRQKLFKLKEVVTVFADEEQQQPLYTITADRWLDFSARYRIADVEGRELGVIQRRGMRSLWRAQYEVERNGMPIFAIQETNPWVKLADGIVGELPVLGMFTGYFLHPAYRIVHVPFGVEAMRLTKRPALFEGRYELDRRAAGDDDEERLALLSVLMLLLLERSRG